MTPHWNLDDFNFRDLVPVLKQCGRAVVREITRGVLERKRPDGLPQKANKERTIIRKGHDTPLRETQFRFAKEATYVVTPHDDHSIKIGVVNPEDANIAAHLQNNGYEFFGITEAAEKEAWEILDTYVAQVVKNAFEARK
jgi:hypothetical protein